MSDKETIRPDGNIIPSSPADPTIRQPSNIIGSSPGVSQSLAPSLGNGPVTLNGKTYEISGHIASMGEAEVYKALIGNQWVIIKYYFNNFSPNHEIVEKLKGFTHPDIIGLLDTAWHLNRFVEVQEYAQGGSLADCLPERDEKQLSHIVREVVEALNACHKQGIIHRDIKPGNIFYRKKGKDDVVIGDFGISSPLKPGESLKLTRRFLTQSYAAPELLTGINTKAFIGKEVDFYSLGITLIHLWTGNDPFGNLPDYEATRLKLDGRVPIPDDLPKRLLLLIKGLLTIEPSKRWGYKEVNDWLEGKQINVFFETPQQHYTRFSFGRPEGKALYANNPVELALLMESFPDTGKRHLYKHTISQWLKEPDPGLFIEIQKVVEEDFPKDVESGFTKALYLLDPDRPFIGPDGHRFVYQKDIADLFIGDKDFFQEYLSNPNAPFYLYLESKGYKIQADSFRDVFSKKTPRAALHFVILSLLNQAWFQDGDIRLNHPSDILKQGKEHKKRLVGELKKPDSLLSVWAESFDDVADSINKWRGIKKTDGDILSVALGMGFPLDSISLSGPDDLIALLNRKPEVLFNKKLDEALAEKLNTWLSEFHDTSLIKTTARLFINKTPDSEMLVVIWDYIMRNGTDAGFDFIDMLRKSIPLVIKKYPDRLDDLADLLTDYISDYLEKLPKGIRFHDRLLRILDFYKEISSESTYASLLQKALVLSDKAHIIENGFASDLNKDAGDQNRFDASLQKRDALLERLRALGLSRTDERIAIELKVLKQLEKKVEKDLIAGKKQKTTLVKDSFKSVTNQRRQMLANMGLDKFYKNIGISLVTGVLAGALVFATNYIDPLAFTKWMGYLTGGIFALAALALLAEFIEDGCLITIGLVALAAYFGYQIGERFKIEYLQYILGGISAIASGWFIFSAVRRKLALSGSHLSKAEKQTMKTNIEKTEEYFEQKFLSEMQYHKTHGASLSWEAFKESYQQYFK